LRKDLRAKLAAEAVPNWSSPSHHILFLNHMYYKLQACVVCSFHLILQLFCKIIQSRSNFPFYHHVLKILFLLKQMHFFVFLKTYFFPFSPLLFLLSIFRWHDLVGVLQLFTKDGYLFI
jgi:hypothetical protein